MTVYLNDQIRFKPTEKGLAIWRERHREIERRTGHLCTLAVDADGWMAAKLWEVMQVYGPHIGLGLESPIEMIELIRRA